MFIYSILILFQEDINQVKDKNPAVMVMITSDIEASDFLDKQYGIKKRLMGWVKDWVKSWMKMTLQMSL